MANVSVGKGTYGPIEILYDAGIAHLSIGHYCSIADNVKFFLGGGHDYKRISTYPFQTKVYKSINAKNRDKDLDIEICDDVWIGYDTILLAGSKIGKGCVIGARSVVTGKIPPYSIYVGNKVIKKRFPDDIIAKLQEIDFSNINHYSNDDYQPLCTEVVTNENIDLMLKHFCE
jgi:acetyltransferase-like isoleucine patch superfamily enzyme